MQLINFIFMITLLGFKPLTNIVQSFQVEEIAGGDVAKQNQFKYQVSIQTNGKHRCGGAIIGDQFVLTAAQCFITADTGQLINKRFIVTTPIYKKSFFNNSSKIYKIKEVYVPKHYKPINPNKNEPYRTNGDIAVVKLKRTFKLNVNANLRALAPAEEDISYIEKNAVLVGQGYYEVSYQVNRKTSRYFEVRRTDGKLRYAVAKVLSNDKCGTRYFDPIHSSHICAKVNQRKPEVPEGSCLDDHGSPLVYDAKIVIGVLVLAPIDCNERNEPGIYTRVSAYSTFIYNATQGITADLRVLTLVKKSKFPKKYILAENVNNELNNTRPKYPFHSLAGFIQKMMSVSKGKKIPKTE